MVLRYPAHRINAIEKYVAESISSAAAGSTIALTDRTLVRCAFSGDGTIDLEAGTEDGLYRILIVETLSGTTRLPASTATVKLYSDFQPLQTGEVLELIYNSVIGRWCEVARSAPALNVGQNKVAYWSAIPGQATLPAANGISFTTATTLTARAVANTNALTYMHRYGIVSTAVAVPAAGATNCHQRTGTGVTGIGYYFTGNGTTRGGFTYITRFAVSDAVLLTTARMFVGLRNSTAIPTNVDQATVTQQIGIAQNDGTSQLFLVSGGTVAQPPINLGPSFVASITTPYELKLVAPINQVNTISYKVTNLDTGAIASGVLSGSAVVVPGPTVLLSGHLMRTNNNTANAVALDVCQIYTETNE